MVTHWQNSFSIHKTSPHAKNHAMVGIHPNHQWLEDGVRHLPESDLAVHVTSGNAVIHGMATKAREHVVHSLFFPLLERLPKNNSESKIRKGMIWFRRKQEKRKRKRKHKHIPHYCVGSRQCDELFLQSFFFFSSVSRSERCSKRARRCSSCCCSCSSSSCEDKTLTSRTRLLYIQDPDLLKY